MVVSLSLPLKLTLNVNFPSFFMAVDVGKKMHRLVGSGLFFLYPHLPYLYDLGGVVCPATTSVAPFFKNKTN